MTLKLIKKHNKLKRPLLCKKRTIRLCHVGEIQKNEPKATTQIRGL